MNAVERIHVHLGGSAAILLNAAEPSYASTVEGLQAKALLLAAASEFETALTKAVLNFCQRRFSYNSIIPEIIDRKAISRQYHTWFNWDGRNANAFFSLFGKEFKEFASKAVSEDDALDKSIKEFLALGAERNLLVHKDFARYAVSSTADEIFARYKAAELFVERVSDLLEEFEQSRMEKKPDELGPSRIP